MDKVSATIVTGFLGSGKTSLLDQIVRSARGGRSRFALIINEFGACGIDREILEGCGIEACGAGEIVELANGCICCTVADDFLPAMTKILARDPAPTHIIIETSGLALPKPLVKAFAWPDIGNRVTVDGVIAVADGVALARGEVVGDREALERQRVEDESLTHESPIEELFEEQIGCADLVVLTKCDLLGELECARARACLVRWLRRGVSVIESGVGRFPSNEVLLGLGMAVEDDLGSRPSHHDGGEDHEHDDFCTISVEFGEVGDREGEDFRARLREVVMGLGVLRVKGFVFHEGRAFREVVQGVGDRIQWRFDKGGDGVRCSRLVFIAERGRLDEERVREMLFKGATN